MLGDFNVVLNSGEKFGGNPVNCSHALKLQECLNECGMIDMGFTGPRFTWTNLRGLTKLIQKRLDRGFCNSSWRILCPEAPVQHLVRINSDHCPVLVSLNKATGLALPRPLRFQPGWLSHSEFPNIVCNA